MIGYKLTDANDCTTRNCQWGEGVTHEAPGTGALCTAGWIHLYESPLLAVLHDAAHGNFGSTAHLWEVDYGGEVKRDGQIKLGASRVTTVRRIDPPVVTAAQQTRYAIACGAAGYSEPRWLTWANGWLVGAECRASAAWTASRLARSVEEARSPAARSAEAAALSAEAAALSAEAATWSVEAAALSAEAGASPNLRALAEWAMSSSTELPEREVAT